jgi:hypothetical protein
VATTKPLFTHLKSLAKLAGLFCIMLLFPGCQTGKSPEDVATQFWQFLAQGQLENARKHTTENTQHLVNLQDIDSQSKIDMGESVIEDEGATVETTISRNKKRVTFNTVMLKEKDAWKVDYLQTQLNISMLPFGEVIKGLQNLGGAFAKQLEQQLPQIQKEMESLGNELKKQVDELGRSLGKPGNAGKPQPHPGTI